MNKLLEIALGEYGVHETVGKEHNQRVVQYSHDCGWKWINDDETPWCSIWMNWVALKANFVRSNSMTARSWLNFGVPVINPKLGDVVIFKRGNSTWQGHVGIYINTDGDYYNILGGNQSNQVVISKYRISKVLGIRKLEKL